MFTHILCTAHANMQQWPQTPGFQITLTVLPTHTHNPMHSATQVHGLSPIPSTLEQNRQVKPALWTILEARDVIHVLQGTPHEEQTAENSDQIMQQQLCPWTWRSLNKWHAVCHASCPKIHNVHAHESVGLNKGHWRKEREQQQPDSNQS